MADTIRMNLNVDTDVPAKLAELAGGPKKMGGYLSHLIQQAHAGMLVTGGAGEFEMLSGTVKHLAAKVKELDGRLQQTEAQVTTLTAQSHR